MLLNLRVENKGPRKNYSRDSGLGRKNGNEGDGEKAAWEVGESSSERTTVMGEQLLGKEQIKKVSPKGEFVRSCVGP